MAHIGRPVGLAEAADGSLLFTDDVNGIIYRVSHDGGEGAPTKMAAAPAPPAPEQDSSSCDGEA